MANIQKLAGKEDWPLELYCWNYALGVFLTGIVLALTLGSFGSAGMSAITNLGQVQGGLIMDALLSGALFKLANILLVAAIDTAEMSSAFPVGVALALVIGTVRCYIQIPKGDPTLLSAGVIRIVGAGFDDPGRWPTASCAIDDRQQARGRKLQSQNSPEASIDSRHQSGRYLADLAGKKGFVKGHDLRDVGDGILRKTRASRWQKDVSWHVDEPHVRCEDHAENGSEPAPAEGIGLNDQDRTRKSGPRATRFIEACPPHIAPRDYHSPEPTLRA